VIEARQHLRFAREARQIFGSLASASGRTAEALRRMMSPSYQMLRAGMLLLLAASMADAAALTITISGAGSGLLNGKPFSGDFTFTMKADTTQLVVPPCCATFDTPKGSPTTFTIAGSSGTLTDDQVVFTYPSRGILGLAHYNDGDLIDFFDPSLRGYQMKTSIGPLTGAADFVGKCPGADCAAFTTSLGVLSFSNVNSVTFNVVVSAPVIQRVTDTMAGGARLSPGMPVKISGTGFGTSATDAASLTIGGKAAPMLGFANGSILSQIPVDVPAGSANVVAVYQGSTSAAFPITVSTYAPVVSCDDGAGAKIPGLPATCMALGLGPTAPPMVTNTKAAAQAPTTTAVQVSIGGRTVQPDYAGLAVGAIGTYQVTFKLPADLAAGNLPVVVSVGGQSSAPMSLAVGAAVPAITAITEAAAFRGKGLAPNTFISIFGVNFGGQNTSDNVFPALTFNGLSVLFNGTPAPLYYVFGQEGQINMVLPAELPESGTVTVQMKNAQGVGPSFPLAMAPASVGVFRIPDPANSARINGAVLFANTAWRVMPASMAKAYGLPSCAGANPAAICGQPAKSGDALVIFLTGLGKATPNGDAAGKVLSTGSLAPPDGSTIYRTVQTPTVTVGGVTAGVAFSGIAPGNAGLYQLNVTVPPGVAAGDDVPVVISMPGSSDTVTIAITGG
jgi:uncharacterized protein (TIGR03437 family)